MKKYIKIISIVFGIYILWVSYNIFTNLPYFVYNEEIEISRNFWMDLCEGKKPVPDANIILTGNFSEKNELYYNVMKIWFNEFSKEEPDPNLLEFESAGEIYAANGDSIFNTGDIGVTFKYDTVRQKLHMTFKKEGNKIIIYPSLSLDNCMWIPDKNGDGLIDSLDIEVIRNKKNFKIQKSISDKIM